VPDKAGTLGPSNCTPGEEAELEYPHLTKRLEMLQFLHRALEEHQNRGDVGLVLEFYNPPPHEGLDSYNTLPRYDAAPRMTVFGTKVDVAQELGMGGAEAIDLLKDLETDEYLNLSYAGSGPYVDAGEVVVDFTEKGLNAIGVLPDPNEALLARLEDIAQALRDLEGVRLDKKKSAVAAVEELKHFVRALPPQNAVELLGKLPSVLGVGNR
jgi:hypothetical protein